MKNTTIIRTTLAVILMTLSLSSIQAQLFYKDSHLFIGQKTNSWQDLGPEPQIFIGTNFGIESYENGLNFWRPWPFPNWGNYKIFLHEEGRVGIGRKPTTYALEVKGEIWTTERYLLTSDGNLKRNIVSLSDNRYDYLVRLKKLEGKAYEKQVRSSEGNADEVAKMVENGKIPKEDAAAALEALNRSNPTTYKKEFGFIAQEVKELFPELVSENASGDLAINYIGLIPLLVESTKALEKKLADLEKRVEGLAAVRSLSQETANEQHPVPGAALYQNVPNPSSTGTTIKYDLPASYSTANLFIYNISGIRVKDYTLTGSSNQVVIAPHELLEGTYIYTLVIDGNRVDTKKMILTN